MAGVTGSPTVRAPLCVNYLLVAEDAVIITGSGFATFIEVKELVAFSRPLMPLLRPLNCKIT